MYGQLPIRSVVLLGLVVAFGFVVPQFFAVYHLYLANTLMMYAVLAIGLDLLLGWAGLFAFAHIAFFGIGIYGTAVLAKHGVSFVFGLPISAAVAALVGGLIAIPSTRLRTVYLALATYAFAECAQWIYRSWTPVTGGVDGLRISPPNVFGYVTGTDPRAFPIVTIILCLVILATLYLQRSKFGRNLCAIRDSEHVAEASGIDVRRVKIAAFMLSAVFASAAGSMFTLFQSFVNADVLGLQQLVLVLIMVVVGGPGSMVGVLLGVVLIGLLPELLRAAPAGLLVWQEFAYGLILILAVMFMPRGLWGVIEKWIAPVSAAKSPKVSTDHADARLGAPQSADGKGAGQ